VGPCGPIAPVAPAAPWRPAGPMEPVAPAAPGAPAGPCTFQVIFVSVLEHTVAAATIRTAPVFVVTHAYKGSFAPTARVTPPIATAATAAPAMAAVIDFMACPFPIVARVSGTYSRSDRTATDAVTPFRFGLACVGYFPDCMSPLGFASQARSRMVRVRQCRSCRSWVSTRRRSKHTSPQVKW
jgi:hypothetical protein